MSDVSKLLGLRRRPIAIGYFDTPPAGVPRWSGGSVPAGCMFWQKAWDGAAFYTVQADHHNCAVGAYTHSIPLAPERAAELEQTVGFMVENKYLDMAEVPGIPTLPTSPAVVAYGPIDQGAFVPTVVLVAATPAQAMLLYEAALKAGAGNPLLNVLGRPGCGVLPLAINGQTSALSFGCRGNRTFTGLPDEELYVAVPGDRWNAVVARLAETLAANQAMGGYYDQKLAATQPG
jgi:uncharacterized protein (DUF169 family)